MNPYPTGYPPSSYDATRTYQNNGMNTPYPPPSAGMGMNPLMSSPMTSSLGTAYPPPPGMAMSTMSPVGMPPVQMTVTGGYPGVQAVNPAVQRTVSVNTFSPRVTPPMMPQPTMTVVTPTPVMTVVQQPMMPQATVTVVQQPIMPQPTMTVVHQAPQITRITHSPGPMPGTVQVTKTTQPIVQQPQVIERIVHQVIEHQEPTPVPKTMTITIEEARTVNNEYTEYDVKVVSDLPQHGIEGYPLMVSKRYNDFLELHVAITEILGADARFLPEFPPKVWFNKLDPTLVQQRKEQFQNLCTFISKEPKLRVSNTIDHFFGITHTRHLIKKASEQES